MKDGILKIVKSFLERHIAPERPILLGFSGGPDSLALLYLFLECRRFFPLDVHLAHVDHGWRKESKQQAEAFAELSAKLGLPFYLERLSPLENTSNLEAKAREARLQFFSRLYQEKGCQALFLAHHADDEAETVLKRALEGSSIFALEGLRSSSCLSGMRLLRPLLTVRKQELIEWLSERGLTGIDDPTNRDPRYLRSRMRIQILPQLSEAFGKEVAMNLVRLGQTCQELKSYLYRKTATVLEQVERGPSGFVVDLNPFLPIEKLEFLALCKQLLEPEGVFFSHAILDQAFAALEKKQREKRFLYKHWKMSVDRGRLEVCICSAY